MKKIFVRSPYFITINEVGQTSAKIEVFLWNKGTVYPTTPTYTLSKNIASPIQTKLSWNVSNLAKSFIKPIAPVSVSVPTEESFDTWCYMKIKRYSNNTLLDTETFICLNGYTNYMNGYNQSTTDTIVPLLNVDIKQLHNKYVNCWIDGNEELESYYWVYGVVEIDIYSDGGVWKLPIDYSNENYLYTGATTFFNIVSNEVCEPIYTPLTCSFINRYGGWQFLTFFKANSSTIEVTSKDFELMPSGINFNPLQGQKKVFNKQGKQRIRCNTGWVNENYSELIQDLLLSEVVLLDNKPVIVRNNNFEVKTILKDKNINYEIEFEYNFGIINDVI